MYMFSPTQVFINYNTQKFNGRGINYGINTEAVLVTWVYLWQSAHKT